MSSYVRFEETFRFYVSQKLIRLLGMTSLSQVRVLAPAKINLFLAVTGVRPDGFHELVSLVVPVDVGDVLDIRLEPELEEDQLDLAGFPVPGALDDNLVMRAIRLFRKRVRAVCRHRSKGIFRSPNLCC